MRDSSLIASPTPARRQDDNYSASGLSPSSQNTLDNLNLHQPEQQTSEQRSGNGSRFTGQSDMYDSVSHCSTADSSWLPPYNPPDSFPGQQSDSPRHHSQSLIEAQSQASMGHTAHLPVSSHSSSCVITPLTSPRIHSLSAVVSQCCETSSGSSLQSSSGHHVDINNSSTDESRPTENEDPQQANEDECTKFVRDTCGCKLLEGDQPCSSLFTAEYYRDVRAQAAFLTNEQLDMAILGSIMATTNTSSNIIHGRHKIEKRSRPRTEHLHNGHNVCVATFAFLHGIGPKHRLQAIKKHYMEYGLAVREHKNTKRLPPKTLTFEEQTAIVKFLQNYSEEHAILLPGRIPGYKRDDLKLLPSSCCKKVCILSVKS